MPLTPRDDKTHSGGTQATVKIPSAMYQPPPELPHTSDDRGRTLQIFSPPIPDGAPELATQIILYDGMDDELLALGPDFPQPFSTPFPPLFSIAPTDNGAGLGMLATAPIPAGHTIVRERPFMLYPLALATPSRAHALSIYAYAVALLPAENQRRVYALANCKDDGAPSTSPLRLKGILDTNSFLAGPLPGYRAAYAGLARDISRVNHRCVFRLLLLPANIADVAGACALCSCVPNAHVSWDLHTLTYALRALRPIRPGEEITISYLSSALLPYAARQEELQRRYAFRCACEACKIEGVMREKSDMARAFLAQRASPDANAQDDALLDQWIAEGARAAANPHHTKQRNVSAQLDGFRLAQATWDLMEREGCVPDALWEPVLARLVKAYSVLCDEERVRKYARRAAELRMAFTGKDGGWTAVAEHPRETEWWAGPARAQ